MADWQEPLKLYNVREDGGKSVGDMPAVYVEVQSERDAWMISESRACINCYCTFPARPSALTLKEFEPFLGRWTPPGVPTSRARERIKHGACPSCGLIVGPETLEHFMVAPDESYTPNYDDLED